MEPLDIALRTVLLGICIIMALVSVQAFRRARDRRMAWVLMSFICFTVLSLMALIGEITDTEMWQTSNALVLLLLLIIGANYLALLKG